MIFSSNSGRLRSLTKAWDNNLGDFLKDPLKVVFLKIWQFDLYELRYFEIFLLFGHLMTVSSWYTRKLLVNTLMRNSYERAWLLVVVAP